MLTGSTYLAAENEALKQKLADARTLLLAARLHLGVYVGEPQREAWMIEGWLKDADKFLTAAQQQ